MLGITAGTFLLEILGVGEGDKMKEQEDFLIELQNINEIVVNDPRQLTSDARKRFWRIVGAIKREISPNPQLVEIATKIRDILYLQKLGPTKPMNIVILIWTACGVGFITSSWLFTIPNMIYLAMILSWVFITIFMLGYFWIINIDFKWSIIIFIAMLGGSGVGDLILVTISVDLLIGINRFLMFAAIPCFYLHGRYVG